MVCLDLLQEKNTVIYTIVYTHIRSTHKGGIIMRKNLANDNVYEITDYSEEYILVDNIDLAIKILEDCNNNFFQHQVVPKDEVESFYGGEQIILHTYEEYLIVMGKILPKVRPIYEANKRKREKNKIIDILEKGGVKVYDI